MGHYMMYMLGVAAYVILAFVFLNATIVFSGVSLSHLPLRCSHRMDSKYDLAVVMSWSCICY